MDKSGSISLSVVMPVFNEAEIIADVIKDFSSVLERFPNSEFIIIDDHSTDNTPQIIRSLQEKYPFIRLIIQPQNQGHGSSLMKAYHTAQGEFVFHCDSDNQFYAEDFWLLFEKLKDSRFDLAIGYRGKRNDPFSRILLTKFLQIFMVIFFGKWLRDSNSPFKLYKRSALDRILPLILERPVVPSILMAGAAAELGMKIAWVDVRHKPRLTGISFIRGWKIFFIAGKATREILKFKKILKIPKKDLPK